MQRKNATASWIPEPLRTLPLALRPAPMWQTDRRVGRFPSHWDLVSTGRVPATGWLARLVEHP